MSPQDQSSLNVPNPVSQPQSAKPNTSVSAGDIDTQSTFQLIDYMLPYPACFYHQLLPLNLTQQYLTVAMVDPDDGSALDFLVSILESMDQVPQLEIKVIDKDILTATLSAYLNLNQDVQNAGARSNNRRTLLQDRTKLQDRSTLILDDQGTFSKESDFHESEPARLRKTPTPTQNTSPRAEETSNTSSSLNIHPQYLSASPEFLVSLPPQQLLVEVLGRVLLKGGIGRLYFERHANRGLILCSQNGIAQVTVENIPLGLFQGTINELKKLARIRPEPIQKTRKFDIAQYYQGKPLLLRVRFMVGKNGEEATLQVLRGKALTFYQRQQVEKIAQESLQLAKQLERKVTQMTLRRRFNQEPVLAVSQLKQLLKKLAQQLETMEK